MISGISPYMPEPNHQAPSATATIAMMTKTVYRATPNGERFDTSFTVGRREAGSWVEGASGAPGEICLGAGL